jgi:hypothetical protein
VDTGVVVFVVVVGVLIVVVILIGIGLPLAMTIPVVVITNQGVVRISEVVGVVIRLHRGVKLPSSLMQQDRFTLPRSCVLGVVNLGMRVGTAGLMWLWPMRSRTCLVVK